MVKARLRNVVKRRIARDAGERVRQVDPRTDEDSPGRERNPLVAQDAQQGYHHAAARRIPSQDDGAGVLRCQEVQICRQTVVEAAREWKLRRQSVFRGKDSRLELAGMALHLIAMFIDAAEEICAAVDVHHDTLDGIAALLPLVGIRPHLDPFSLERRLWFPPLPPSPAAHLTDAVSPQLCRQQLGRARQMLLRYGHLVDLYPLRMRHPLGGERLQLLDRVMRGKVQERSNQVQPFVVGQVCCRPLPEGLPVEVLRCCQLHVMDGMRMCVGFAYM